jgi:hypothetical protein
MKKRIMRNLALAACLVTLPACNTWYGSINSRGENKFTLSGTQFGGALASEIQLWSGTFDPATNTMTVKRIATHTP